MRWNAIAFSIVVGIATVASAETSLRIVTFNAEWLVYSQDETDSDNWGTDYTIDEHYERVAGIIETLEPDIVNLVEITTAEGAEFLVDVLHAKGLTSYSWYHIASNDTSTGQDIAVIAKLEPDTVDGTKIRKFYSAHAGEEWREPYEWQTAGGVTRHATTSISKNAVYYFTIGGKKLGFLGLHLKAIPDNTRANAQRTAQSRVAQKIIREQIVARGYTPIVLGDLNDYDDQVEDRDPATSTQTTVLRNLKDYDSASTGDELRNAAEKISREFDRYTSHWDQNHNDIADEGEPMTMIDHILIHKDLWPHVKRVFTDHGHGARTSDHWPVVVDLEWP